MYTHFSFNINNILHNYSTFFVYDIDNVTLSVILFVERRKSTMGNENVKIIQFLLWVLMLIPLIAYFILKWLFTTIIKIIFIFKNA